MCNERFLVNKIDIAVFILLLCFPFSLPITVPTTFLCLCLSTRQPKGGVSLRKMLGSERSVVEEWLSEFKVKALDCATLIHES